MNEVVYNEDLVKTVKNKYLAVNNCREARQRYKCKRLTPRSHKLGRQKKETRCCCNTRINRWETPL